MTWILKQVKAYDFLLNSLVPNHQYSIFLRRKLLLHQLRMKKRHLLMLKRWCVNSNPKSKSKRIFLAQDIEFIWFLSDCVMNVLSGVVPINKKELQQFEPQLRQLSEKYFSALERSKLFQTTRGHSLIQLIARPCLEYLQKNANWGICAHSSQHVYNWTTSSFANIKQSTNKKQVETTIASTENFKTRATRSGHTAEHRATDRWRHGFRWRRKATKYPRRQ